MTAYFFIRTGYGYVPEEQATEAQKASQGEIILQNMGKVVAGE